MSERTRRQAERVATRDGGAEVSGPGDHKGRPYNGRIGLGSDLRAHLGKVHILKHVLFFTLD